jgi:ABC-type transport system involved in cytochrome bd biosynthesis fused ATPase/permease subunit
MLTVTLVVIVLIVVFVVAFISPKRGTKAQKRSAALLKKLKSAISSWPKAIKKITSTGPKLSQKAVQKSAAAGKKSRRKVNNN